MSCAGVSEMIDSPKHPQYVSGLQAGVPCGPTGETSETTACQYSHRDRAELLPLRTLMPPQDTSWETDAGHSATAVEDRTPFATMGA